MPLPASGVAQKSGSPFLFCVMTRYDVESDDDRARWEALADRAAAAREQAAVAVRRAAELQALIASVRRDAATRCAWCGRIAPGPTTHAVTDGAPAEERYSEWRLPPSTRSRLTHGICPKCYERVGGDGA